MLSGFRGLGSVEWIDVNWCGQREKFLAFGPIPMLWVFFVFSNEQLIIMFVILLYMKLSNNKENKKIKKKEIDSEQVQL